MKIGIMQPYFFPYIGYYSLIQSVDEFILLDDVQFIRHGWIERNRIIKQGGGWLYFAAPLRKHSQKDLIRDIRIDNSKDWKSKIISNLRVYKWAPNYKEVMNLIEECLAGEYIGITELNCHILKATCDYIGIQTPISIFREMGIGIDKPQMADEWALNICKKIPNVTEYRNPSGGMSFFDRKKYERAGIKLQFQQMYPIVYQQGRRKEFESDLSIVDVLMFNDCATVRFMLDQYQLL